MEDILKYMYNPYYAVPFVAILSTFLTKALNIFWENQVHDQVWSGVSSVLLAVIVIDYSMQWQLVALQIMASFALSALSYKYLGTWFVDRVFVALKSRLEKWFSKEEVK